MNCFLIFLLPVSQLLAANEEDHGVKYANKCEVCKILAVELQDRLTETGKTKDVLELGYSFDKNPKKIEYKKSETRLIESLENVCERILEYNIHKEREDSSRFAKDMSQTFKVLHNLVDKGVKVDLGMPYELWDKPSAEITNMKAKCEGMVEEWEEAIEAWYWGAGHGISLSDYLCRQRVLSPADTSCLNDKADSSPSINNKQEL